MADTENVIQVSEATFETDVVERSFDVPVVVDFWAPWCGPCHMLTPILERIAADPAYNFVLAKVNVDLNPNLSVEYGVRGIPAVKAFRHGDIIAEFTGAQPEGRVLRFIQQVAPSELDHALTDAESLLVTRHWAAAEEAYREILQKRPHQSTATINLARALLGQGEGCEALEYLEQALHTSAQPQAQRLLPLARFLCDASSELFDEDITDPMDQQYRQAARLWLNDNPEAAMDGLLDVLRQNKRYRRGEPKNVLLGIFELLGDVDPLTQTYRSELASVLY
ncbi:MAG: tetratricopeptide repeat protein [Anaerolineales bacterium]|nr:tetratricopeptide repeat protein [Anaerolineales bacterium]